MTSLDRFVSNTLTQYFGKEYTPEQIIAKLKSEIRMLESSLFHLEPDCNTYREKKELLKIKRENLEEVERENYQTS